MRLPEGTRLIRDAQTSPPGFTVLDTGSPPRYRFRIDPMVVEKLVSSPQEQVSEHLKAVDSQKAGWTLVSQRTLKVGEADAAELWTSRALDDGTVAVMGWIVVQVGPASFLTFSAMTVGSNMATAQRAMDDSVSTLAFINNQELGARAASRNQSARSLLERIQDTECLRSLAASDDLWYRIWQPGPDGRPGEIGYLRQATMLAPRAAVDNLAQEPDAKTGPGSREGLLVRLQSRTLLAPDGSAVSDTDARYWVALDRSEELWSVVVTDRANGKVRSIARSGIRPRVTSAEPVPALVVSETAPKTKEGNTRRWSPPVDQYLTQAESLLQGRLAKVLDIASMDTALYCYDGRLQSVPQRIERWRRTGTGWTIETSTLLDAPPAIATYADDGSLIKRIDPGGTITERIAPTALMERWRALGLPTGESQR